MHGSVHRRAVVSLAGLLLAACEPPAREPDPPARRWVYPPGASGWPLGVPRGRIGRSQAPQAAVRLGITGEPTLPLRLPTVWSVPGDGPARAVIYGLEGTRPAIELVDVDEGRVIWRDTETCAGPIVGVTEDAIVCADASGTRGLAIATARGEGTRGGPGRSWRSEAPFVAMTGEHVVVGPTGEAVILDPASGDELSRVTLPAGVLAESIVASCGDAGRELFATGTEGQLIRIADAKGGAAIAWTAPVGAVEELAACEGDHVLVRTPGGDGSTLVSLARLTGEVVGRIDGVRGWWPARTGEGVEVSTELGVARYGRELTAGTPLALPSLGPLLAARADRRLVRVSPRTAVVLDARGVRAYVSLAALGAALGDRALVAATWAGSEAETVRRLALPARYPRALRLPGATAGVAIATELRDVPEPEPVATSAAIALPSAGGHEVGAIAIDPGRGAIVYAATHDDAGAGLAAIDLAKGAWSWHRPDACAPGTLVGIAVADDVIVCGARGAVGEGARVRATREDGTPRWEWTTEALDAVAAAGDSVLAFAADRLHVLDAGTGQLRGRIRSDDGAPVRAAAVAVGATTVVIAYERGRIVARLADAGLVPAWSVVVDGVVRAISASEHGVLVELDDGDAFRIDARTGDAVAIAGLGLAWLASGDLIAGVTAGGDIPGVAPPPPPAPAPRERPARPVRRRALVARDVRPRLWTPIPPPPPRGTSLQLAVYELNGGLRTRNDYPVTGGAVAPVRGPAGSPLLVTERDGTEVLVLDPATGDPVRRVTLPVESAFQVFSTVVEDRPVAGAVLAKPLRIVLF